VPLIFPIYLAGWDRTDVVPSSTILIHHPGGLEKKISVDLDPPAKSSTFWRVFTWDHGVTEGGSSGGPMFDPAGRFIGNMDSGASICSAPNNDFCTRLAVAWPLLEPYLDPLGTGQTTMDGLDRSTISPAPFTVTAVLPAQIPVVDPSTVRNAAVGSGSGLDRGADQRRRPPDRHRRDGRVLDPEHARPPPRSTLHALRARTASPSRCPRGRGDAQSSRLPTASRTSRCSPPTGSTPTTRTSPATSTTALVARTCELPPAAQPGINGGFTDIRYCQISPIGRVHPRPPPDPVRQDPFNTTVVYNQAACISHGHPFAVTNIQQTLYVF
jgi:hypothetical protein